LIFILPSSTIYRIHYLEIEKPELNYSESYHIYAWYLFQEGEIDKAKANLKLALEQLQNPDNLMNKFGSNTLMVEDYLLRYERALQSIEAKNWPRFETNVSRH
jgi:Tfp pilus assembly protein PilF